MPGYFKTLDAASQRESCKHYNYSLTNILGKLSIFFFFSGDNPKVQQSNMTRECIRYFFPVRKCFVFDRPTSDKRLLLQIENVPENQLERNFQVESEKFCSYIFTNGKTKTLRGGVIVTGNREFLLSQACLCGLEHVKQLRFFCGLELFCLLM